MDFHLHFRDESFDLLTKVSELIPPPRKKKSENANWNTIDSFGSIVTNCRKRLFSQDD